jgi:hypothetical protein
VAKVKGDWDAWNARRLAEEPIIRLILDGTVMRVRLDRKATSIVLLVVLGVRDDGQKGSPLVSVQRRTLPLGCLALRAVEPGARHRDLDPAKGPHQ